MPPLVITHRATARAFTTAPTIASISSGTTKIARSGTPCSRRRFTRTGPLTSSTFAERTSLPMMIAAAPVRAIPGDTLLPPAPRQHRPDPGQDLPGDSVW